MTDPKTLQFLWQYMTYADRQVLAAMDSVDDEGYGREQGISAGSLHKLLVHCLSAQTTWLQRLGGVSHPPPALDPASIARRDIAGRWAALHQELLAFAAAQTPASGCDHPIRQPPRGGVRAAAGPVHAARQRPRDLPSRADQFDD